MPHQRLSIAIVIALATACGSGGSKSAPQQAGRPANAPAFTSSGTVADEGTVKPVEQKAGKPLRIVVLGLESSPFWIPVKAGVERVQVITYVVCGGLAALAGILTTGLLGTASTNLGQGVELDVIAAAVIGGTSLNGGEGSVVGTLIGAAIMAVVRNAFVLLGLPLHWQVMIIGVVILLAVGLDRRRRR